MIMITYLAHSLQILQASGIDSRQITAIEGIHKYSVCLCKSTTRCAV